MNAPAVVEWPIQSSPRRKTLLGADKQLLPGRGKVILCLVGRASPNFCKSPLASLRRLSVEADRRHDRRSLTEDEFVRLIEAAESGPTIEGLSGNDRSMLYIVASWTGYRRRELSSLTLKSLRPESDSPTITVTAAYSRRRRKDTQPFIQRSANGYERGWSQSEYQMASRYSNW